MEIDVEEADAIDCKRVAKRRQSIQVNPPIEKKAKRIQTDLSPKNINDNIYMMNPLLSIESKLCEKTLSLTYYIDGHAYSEMYFARPSPEMAEKIRNCSKSFTREPNSKLIDGFCYFCEESYKLSLFDWKQHFSIHTGETNRLKDSTFGSTNDVSAFICDSCNFVQMEKMAIEKHLMIEHEMNDAQSISGYYSAVTLVPNSSSFSLFRTFC